MFSDHMRTRLMTAVAGALAVGVLAAAGAAQAHPGDLDSSFGAGGVVLSNLGVDKGSTIDDVAVQPDGRVVALESGYGAGVPHLLRYLPDGSPDPSFSGDGIAPIPAEIWPGDVALQADGKILVSGGAPVGDFALARFLPNGELDQDFDGDTGNANGVLHTQVSAVDDHATSVTLDSQQRIVVAGFAEAALGTDDVAIARYLPDGHLDKSFSGDGKLVVDTAVAATISDVATQGDGKIVVAGGWGPYPNTDTMIQRFTESGAADPFGGNAQGRKILDLGGVDLGAGVAVQPNGELIVGSSTFNGQGRLISLSANGELDTGFASGGNVPLEYSLRAIGLAPDGKIILAGYRQVDGQLAFAVERRNPDGTADVGFAGGSPVYTHVVPGERSYLNVAAIAPDGDIVVAGETGVYPGSRAAIARYQGAPDPPGGTAGPAPSSPTVDTPVTLTGLRITRRAFAVGPSRTPRVGQAQAARRHKRGTAFVFRLNRTASVTIRIKRLARTRTARRNTRVATLRRTGRVGGNRVRFSGRVGRRALRPGRYRATLAATDASGSRSTPRTVTFRILPG